MKISHILKQLDCSQIKAISTRIYYFIYLIFFSCRLPCWWWPVYSYAAWGGNLTRDWNNTFIYKLYNRKPLSFPDQKQWIYQMALAEKIHILQKICILSTQWKVHIHTQRWHISFNIYIYIIFTDPKIFC